ncbi:hypothetical protein [Aeromonas tecta]|uniref:hypothetical protein n=1 Tax=Aeromonas tecta TaxID=324617 RepID=UPI0018DC4B0D|nr:hypothetical protein [Aeromonas tecta]
MEQSDRPSLRHRPHASQPDPSPARQLAPWYLQHRDKGWEAFDNAHQESRPAWE